MSFSQFDFDGMREWLKKIPCSDPRIIRARLITFDLMRYREAYDEIYNYITVMGGVIHN